jgi:hypothetical protein
LKEILPTDSEIKAFKDFSKQVEFRAEALVEAETALYHLAQIDQLKQRVASMLFLNTWESSLQIISTRSEILSRTVGKLLVSNKLA